MCASCSSLIGENQSGYLKNEDLDAGRRRNDNPGVTCGEADVRLARAFLIRRRQRVLFVRLWRTLHGSGRPF